MARSAKARSRTETNTLVHVRLSRTLLDRITAWSAKAGVTSRTEAIRRLVETGLAATSSSRGASAAKRAAELAEKVVIKRIDPALPPAEKAARKRRILKGPSDFVQIRKDKMK